VATKAAAAYQSHCHRRRSPAEGAYSEGFISSKLNQEYCIECPGTGSTFDFRSGEIVDWYPTNMVLRLLTPKGTCRNLETYPVRLEQVSRWEFHRLDDGKVSGSQLTLPMLPCGRGALLQIPRVTPDAVEWLDPGCDM